MLRLAYFSPLPPQRTGIADYSADLLLALSSLSATTLFVDDPEAIAPYLKAQFPIRPITAYPEERWAYDLALYQMGNSVFHGAIYEMALRYPGVVVLHDYVLHHLIATLTVGAGNFAAYVREMAYARGLEGIAKAREIARGASTPLFTWALNARLVDVSLGVLVHSRFVQDKLLAAHPRARVAQIAQPVPLPVVRDRQKVRTALGLSDDAFILMTCGAITPEKRLDVVLECFKAFSHRHSDALWLIVGEPKADVARWRAQLQAAGLGDSVREIGYIEGLALFYDYLAASDVCVNLRDPTAGETSASVLRAMAVGTPVIVSDVGWYSELPDCVSAKVVHDGAEAVQLLTVLERWYADAAARRSAGAQARAYVAQTCDPASVAEAYVAFCKANLIPGSLIPGCIGVVR